MKLSARGRTVLAQVSKVTDLPLEVGEPSSAPCRKVRTTLALLSDGHIAIKHTWLKADGKVDHSDGWRGYKRLRAEHRTPSVNEESVARWTERYTTSGYTVDPIR